MKIIEGDLLEAKEQYIAHQCNLVTNRAANLALSVFSRYPYANIYAERKYPHDPEVSGPRMGDIIIRGNGDDQRLVINMCAQYYPGKPKFALSKRDGYEARQEAFAACLEKISKIPGLKSIAFPWGIGCGAAGGDWEKYQKMISEFESSTPGVEIRIYKKS
jgi:O-acetyl-ADP-ribose deacetylase (regulator of RNase III)